MTIAGGSCGVRPTAIASENSIASSSPRPSTAFAPKMNVVSDAVTTTRKNEKRALKNRDRVGDPRADMLWMPLNMMPIGEGAVAMEERLARLHSAKATEETR